MAKLEPPELNQTKKEFYTLYGSALSCWADLEFIMSFWFSWCFGSPSNAAVYKDVFYSARTSNSRIDMLVAAFKSKRRDKDLSALFTELIKLARAYSSFRNTLAHDLHWYIEPQDKMLIARGSVSFPDFDERSSSIQQVKAAQRNFWRLKTLFLNTFPGLLQKPLLTPKQGLAQARRLPQHAHLAKRTQSAKDAGRRRQSRLGAKQ